MITMKHGILQFLSILLFLVIVDGVRAQGLLSNVYLWQHRLSTTTTPQDSTFDVKWEQVSIWSDSLAWYYRSGASSTGIDTTSWDSRPAIRVSAGDIVMFGPTVKLRRFEWWMDQGTDYINFFGLKRSAQF